MTVAKGMVYSFNAENRLVEASPQNPQQGSIKSTYVYDYMGRRVKKTLYTYSSGSWQKQKDQSFIYDGWNIVKESEKTSDSSPEVPVYYVWGLDLSQSMQGGGGVGGLIASVKTGNEYLYSFDANGNVGQMVKSSDGSIAASYEYDPFGKTIFSEGPMASENPYRFSTKYQDGETGFYYYGFRYYDAEMGRWINRDPIGEVGGINRFAFVNNKSLNSCDVLGLYLASGHTEITSEAIQNEKWSKDINTIINKVEVILIKNNLQVDEEFLKFNYWHFNRDKGKESSDDAKKKFSNNLDRIKYDFYTLIDKSEDVDCQDALRKLGNMTHAWQDYYAHAMRENTKGEGFEIKIFGFVTSGTMDLVPIGYIHGDPEHIPSFIIPSSFGSIPKYGIGGSYDLGEHGPTEPGGGLRAPDSERRKRLATQFTKEQLATYIVDWFLKCRCTATVESWRKPNGNIQK